jgi:hypothetical protein
MLLAGEKVRMDAANVVLGSWWADGCGGEGRRAVATAGAAMRVGVAASIAVTRVDRRKAIGSRRWVQRDW